MENEEDQKKVLNQIKDYLKKDNLSDYRKQTDCGEIAAKLLKYKRVKKNI